MRRLFRWAFNVAAAVAAVLFVGVCVLWVRAPADPPFDDYFVAIRPGQSYGLGTEWGRAVIGFLQRERPDYRDNVPANIQLRAAGFRYLRITSDGMRRWNLVLPFWLLASWAAALPAWWVWRLLADRRRARRARRLGLCPSCSYDLRATPGRCPECGAVPKA